MSWPNYEKYQHLHQTSIQVLNLSDKAFEALSFYGLTDVADCINFFINHMLAGYYPSPYTKGIDGIIFDDRDHEYARTTIRPWLFYYMVTEVRPKLQVLDYWQFVEEAENLAHDKGDSI
jgi:hypothetical protein